MIREIIRELRCIIALIVKSKFFATRAQKEKPETKNGDLISEKPITLANGESTNYITRPRKDLNFTPWPMSRNLPVCLHLPMTRKKLHWNLVLNCLGKSLLDNAPNYVV